MSLMNNRAKNRPTNKTSIMGRKLVHRTNSAKVPFIKQSVVPAGTYIARVTAVKEAQTTAGDDAIDIVYELTSTKGTVVTAKERYPVDGYVLEKLIAHWFDNNLLPEDATYADIVGIEETVDISFVNPKALGSVANRRPIKQVTNKTAPPKKSSGSPVNDDTDEVELEEEQEEELDDEFDDFLEEDEEDDL